MITLHNPFESVHAASTASATRERSESETSTRSIITSIECLYVFASRICFTSSTDEKRYDFSSIINR